MKIFSLRVSYLWAFLACSCLYAYSIYLQEVGLRPCPLCVLQRFSMVLLAFTFLIAYFVKIRRKPGQLIAGGLSLLFSLLGMAFAARQVWLQHLGYVPSGESCAASLQYMLQVLPFEEALKNIFQGSTECSQIGWQFLSLSLSEWSLISFATFLLFSLYQMFRKYK